MPVSKIGTNALSSGLDVSSTNISYTGTLTGGTGVVNIGSGQVYKDASGNVGIGTSSPGAKLEVAGGSFLFANNQFLQQRDSSGNAKNIFGANTSNEVNIGGVDGSSPFATIRLFTGGNERARIDSSGNLLVGTTSQVAQGKINVVYSNNSHQGLCFNENSGSGLTRDAVRFQTSGTQVGSISVSTTATAYNTSSDYRLKEDIQPMTGALARVTQLKPVTYKWKSSGEAAEGFIAHELQAVVPDCVTGEKDAVDAEGNPIYQGIDTSFLVATLTAAIQELKAELDSVKAELAVLKGV